MSSCHLKSDKEVRGWVCAHPLMEPPVKKYKNSGTPPPLPGGKVQLREKVDLKLIHFSPLLAKFSKFTLIYTYYYPFFQISCAARTFFMGKNSKVEIGGWERSHRIWTLFTMVNGTKYWGTEKLIELYNLNLGFKLLSITIDHYRQKKSLSLSLSLSVKISLSLIPGYKSII